MNVTRKMHQMYHDDTHWYTRPMMPFNNHSTYMSDWPGADSAICDVLCHSSSAQFAANPISGPFPSVGTLSSIIAVSTLQSHNFTPMTSSLRVFTNSVDFNAASVTFAVVTLLFVVTGVGDDVTLGMPGYRECWALARRLGYFLTYDVITCTVKIKTKAIQEHIFLWRKNAMRLPYRLCEKV